jgi:hypothetical protein
MKEWWDFICHVLIKLWSMDGVACVSKFGDLSSWWIFCASYYIAKLHNRQHITECTVYRLCDHSHVKPQVKHLLILLGTKKILLCNVPGQTSQSVSGDPHEF